jgi:hypothetical protein
MGGKATKTVAATLTHTETNGYKEEDRLWSIINIHLICAINTMLSLCAVIFVLCLLAFIIHRIVRRYCKKRRAAKDRENGLRMLPFTIPRQPPYAQKFYGQRFNDYNTFPDRYQQRFPNDSNSMRFSDYIKPPGRSNTTTHHECAGSGLVVPYSSHKREIAGSNPGWAH